MGTLVRRRRTSVLHESCRGDGRGGASAPRCGDGFRAEPGAAAHVGPRVTSGRTATASRGGLRRDYRERGAGHSRCVRGGTASTRRALRLTWSRGGRGELPSGSRSWSGAALLSIHDPRAPWGRHRRLRRAAASRTPLRGSACKAAPFQGERLDCLIMGNRALRALAAPPHLRTPAPPHPRTPAPPHPRPPLSTRARTRTDTTCPRPRTLARRGPASRSPARCRRGRRGACPSASRDR